MSDVYTVALTGGIGSGKSTVADLFAELGVPVIDSDYIARDIVQPGKPAYEEIVKQFGTKVLDQEKKVDRQALAEIVFNDKSEKRILENILHPEVYTEIDRQISSISFPYCIVMIPLLVETDASRHYDRVLLIDIPENLQLQRTSKRDNKSEEMIKKIIASQASRETRREYADDIIDNSVELEQLKHSVGKLHKKYLLLSK